MTVAATLLALLACSTLAPPAAPPPTLPPPTLTELQRAERAAFRTGENARLLAALAKATQQQAPSAMAEVLIAGRAHDPTAFADAWDRFTADLVAVDPTPETAQAAALLYDAARTPTERAHWREVAHSTLARWRWSPEQRDATVASHAGITRAMAHRALDTVSTSYVEPLGPESFAPAITRLTVLGVLPAVPERLDDPHAMLDLLVDSATAAGLPESSAIAETVEAMFSGLDQWTKPVWPTSVAAWQNQHDGVVPGVVGVGVDDDDTGVYVRQLVEGGAAWTAGLHVDDRVIAVDGHPVTDATTAAASLRGANGTSVSLRVSRDNGEPSTVELVRGSVTPRTTWGWRRNGTAHDPWVAPRVGFLHIASFRPHTEAEIADLLPAPDTLDGLVLDLRGNGGGDLAVALKLADRFVDAGPLVQVQTRMHLDRPKGWGHATSPSLWVDVPLVVLVDRHTASSAEIVAGALQLHGAFVIGEPTTGKGTGQLLRTDDELGFALQFTHLRWQLADGRPLHRSDTSTTWGIQPDHVDRLTPTERFVIGVQRARRQALPVHADGSAMPWRGPEVDPALPPYSADPIVTLALSRLRPKNPRTSDLR